MSSFGEYRRHTSDVLLDVGVIASDANETFQLGRDSSTGELDSGLQIVSAEPGSFNYRRMHSVDPRRALYEHDHRIVAHCSQSGRWKTLRLLDFVKIGKDQQQITRLSLRCGMCGEEGAIQIRPPTPRIEKYGPASQT